ncbi:unnamed protein product [Effrenium voratum]|nr:unnamed protein product [Effrenium voratum]
MGRRSGRRKPGLRTPWAIPMPRKETGNGAWPLEHDDGLRPEDVQAEGWPQPHAYACDAGDASQGDDATGNGAWPLEHDDGLRPEDNQAEGWPQPHAYACDPGDASQGDDAAENAAWPLEHDDGLRPEDVQAEGWPQTHAYACDAGDASQGDDATGNGAWPLEHDDGVRHEDVQAEGWPQPHAYACDAGDASQGDDATGNSAWPLEHDNGMLPEDVLEAWPEKRRETWKAKEWSPPRKRSRLAHWPAPQELTRWTSGSSWRSDGSQWEDRGISSGDRKDIEQWLECSRVGDNLPGTPLIPCKTPFEGSLARWAYNQGLLPEDQWFGKEDLLHICEEKGTPVGLVIDLVNTSKYYRGFSEFDGVEYQKVSIPGRQVPDREVVEEIFDTIDDFTFRKPELYVAVHCTHGVNRTGFLLAAYLMTRCDVPGWRDAVEVFETARGSKIDKAYLLEALKRLEEGKY